MDNANAAAGQTLAGWINALRNTNGFVKGAAASLAPIVEAEIITAANEQRSVDGQAWKPTQSGQKALKNVKQHVSSRALDNVIVITLSGHYVFHNFGTRRNPQRAILPTRGMPKKLGNAIRKGLVDMGQEWMTRAGRHDKGSGGVRMKPSMR